MENNWKVIYNAQGMVNVVSSTYLHGMSAHVG